MEKSLSSPFAFLKGRAVLAPMAGITDLPFRCICQEMGCAMTVTEMVSAKGYIYAPNNLAQAALLRRRDDEVLSLQLFGSEPEFMQRATEILSQRPYVAIDINMGCPAKKIVGGGDGSALLKKPELALQVAETVVKASQKPVTVKLRKGWDENSAPIEELAQALEQAGVSMLAVHGRTREQQYTGKADWDCVARVKKAVRIPVIGNGDIKDARQAFERMEQTGCDAVMIGRGALGNPWIFQQFEDMRNGREVHYPTPQERIDMAILHVQKQIEFAGEKSALLEMRKHMAWYTHGMRDATQVRQMVNTARNMETMLEIMRQFKAGL